MLLRQTVLYLPAQLLGPLLQFVSAIVWTHFLSPHEMGVLALIVAAQELIVAGTLSWFTFYTVRYYDVDAPREARLCYLNTENAVFAGASFAALAIILTLPLFITADWSFGLVAAAAAYTISRNLATHLTDRSRAERDTLTYSLHQILWPLLGLIFGIAFVWLFEPTASVVLAGYATAQILTLAITSLRSSFGQKLTEVSRDVARQAFRYGFPLLVGAVLFWVAGNGLRYVVEFKEGAAAVGLITVGWGLGLRAANVAAMLVTAAAFPIAVAKARSSGIDAGQQQLTRNGVLLMAALVPAGVGLWIISDPLVTLVVAEPFREITAAVLPFATLAGVARNLRVHFASHVFVLRENAKIVLLNDGIDAVATIAGAAIGLWAGGLVGAVIGATAGAALSLVIDFALGGIIYHFHMPWADLLRISTAAAVMGLVVGALPQSPSVFYLALAVGLGAMVYALCLAALFPEVRQALLEILQRLKRQAVATKA